MAATRRAGFTVSPDGKQAALPWLDDKFLDERTYPATTWVGRARAARSELVGMAQRLHSTFELLRTANGKPVAGLPTPEVRQSVVREFGKKAASLIDQLDVVEKEVAAKRASLRPFKQLDGVSSFARRQELRSVYRSMSKEERQRALRDDEFRYAVTEMSPLVTGILPADHALIVEEQLRKEYPRDVADLDDAQSALDTVRSVAGNVVKAIDAEAVASGARTPAPPAEVEITAATAWH